MKFLLSLIVILLILIFIELLDAWLFLLYLFAFLFGGLLLSIIPFYVTYMHFEEQWGYDDLSVNIFSSILFFFVLLVCEIWVLYIIYFWFLS